VGQQAAASEVGSDLGDRLALQGLLPRVDSPDLHDDVAHPVFLEPALSPSDHLDESIRTASQALSHCLSRCPR
jgi:hypothetical protein